MLEKAEYLNKLGVHKQYINRFLMPFSFSEVVITGDQFAFNHFFNLRCNKDVEPNFRNIANKMKELYLNNEPKFLNENDYHIAYDNEIDNNIQGIDRLLVSASMCARISYDIDKNESLEKHKERALKCYQHGHFSVFEHQLRTIKQNEINDRLYYSNIRYYVTMRKDIELYNLNLEQ
jgi:thymidylate synthase ThyX